MAQLGPGATRTKMARPTSLLVGSAASGGAFVVLALLVALKWSPLMRFDRERMLELNHLDGRSPAFVDAARGASAVASTTGWLVALGAAALCLLARRRWRSGVFVAVTGFGSPVLNTVLKDMVQRPRPVFAHPIAGAHDWSFPSAHTQAATVGCAVLLVVVLPSVGRVAGRWAVAGGVAVVTAVGLSRMSLGVHYPSDVAAAVLCGLAWTLFTAWVLQLAPRR